MYDLTVPVHGTVALGNGVVVSNCDDRCQGKSCGACTYGDLKIRQQYLQAGKREEHIDVSMVQPVDQRSQAFRLRVRIVKPDQYRFVSNDHWRFNLRRAAFRAQRQLHADAGIAKRSIRFASDEIKAADYTSGVDYVEFGITRPISSIQIHDFLACINHHLGDWLHLHALNWVSLSAKARTLHSDIDLNLFELDVDDAPEQVLNRLRAWHTADTVPMRLRIDAGYFAPPSEEVDAKTYVEDIWAIRNGHRPALRMLVRGRPTPYNVWAALMHRPSWRDAARHPAVRLEAFLETDRDQQDCLRPNCTDCGRQIPTTVLEEPYDPQRCPYCLDRHLGIVIEHDPGRNPMHTHDPSPQPGPADPAEPVETDEGRDAAPDPSNTPIYQLVEPLERDDDSPARLLAGDTSHPDGDAAR